MSESVSRHRRKLKAWRERNAQRDALIIDAFTAGMTVIEIHQEMGIARSTVYETIRKEHPEWLEKSQRTVQKVS